MLQYKLNIASKERFSSLMWPIAWYNACCIQTGHGSIADARYTNSVPGQSKDHTVQAAMRLRQLATTQSVTFFAPPEVFQSISDYRKKSSSSIIDSHDVICWLLEQTCSGIEQLQPLYWSQGKDFLNRSQALMSFPHFVTDETQRADYLKILKQRERQTLEELYAPRLRAKTKRTVQISDPRLQAFMKDLDTRKKGFRDTGDAVHASALQEVEQEREVAYEVEAVREIQKPIHYSPLTFGGLHRDILLFARRGILTAKSPGYEPMTRTLSYTATGRKHTLDACMVGKLYVSAESSVFRAVSRMITSWYEHTTKLLQLS